MDARNMLEKTRRHAKPNGQHTLEELFAGILLEECFVDNGAGQIVDHEMENRLNLLLCVASVVRDSLVL